jgi:hypothetical protein
LGLQPRKPIDLVPLPVSAGTSAEENSFAEHILGIHADVHLKIASSNKGYNNQVDLHCRHAKFEAGDQVMVHIWLGGFPTSKYKKLQYRNMGPYKILQKMSSNASVLDLPEDIGTSNIFNIEDLTLYLGHIDTSSIDAPTLQPQFP